MDNILHHKPATWPPHVVDTSSETDDRIATTTFKVTENEGEKLDSEAEDEQQNDGEITSHTPGTFSTCILFSFIHLHLARVYQTHSLIQYEHEKCCPYATQARAKRKWLHKPWH